MSGQRAKARGGEQVGILVPAGTGEIDDRLASLLGGERRAAGAGGGVSALPLTPAYSISKAAAFSLTQSLRALLAGRGVRVHAVLTGPVDTDMTRGFDIPKASAESVARAIFDGVENGEEDIFPDPTSASLADGWRDGVAKAFERQNATFVQPQPAAT